MGDERILKDYYEQLCAHKFHNLDEIGQFLKRYNLLKFTQGVTDNLKGLFLLKN